ncbi:hypothetical protein BJ322DRAFT_268925 [Thelephora terrestris]|uniref:Uncharacterized protein n=1 Tax=Thelephora terrestris TaxID=56493 RepID=A0A9P6L403_9AGAM|nr:hypothetical protein BJ322DRAFT_268925 [Thelephora terrestris]
MAGPRTSARLPAEPNIGRHVCPGLLVPRAIICRKYVQYSRRMKSRGTMSLHVHRELAMVVAEVFKEFIEPVKTVCRQGWHYDQRPCSFFLYQVSQGSWQADVRLEANRDLCTPPSMLCLLTRGLCRTPTMSRMMITTDDCVYSQRFYSTHRLAFIRVTLTIYHPIHATPI